MFLALVSVMVALYGTARTIAIQAVMSMICWPAAWTTCWDEPDLRYAGFALSFASISPALTGAALRRRLEARTALAHTSACTDPLTKVANRRGLESQVPPARRTRPGRPSRARSGESRGVSRERCNWPNG